MTRTHEQLRRRKAILSWIPAAVLLVIILAVVGVAITARTIGVGTPPTTPPSDAVTAKGASVFTPAGLAYIADTRKVLIDATELPVAAKPLGLEPTATLTIAPPTEGIFEYLTVVGPGGGMRFMGTSIDIVSVDGRVHSASIADNTRVLSYRDTLALFRERAERFGIPASELAGFEDAAAAARAEKRDYSYSMHTDDALGVGLTVTADCSSASLCRIADRIQFG
jgi:hypothetical protein